MLSLFLGDPTGTTPRMVHYAFNCPSMEELDTWKTHLESSDVSVRGPMAQPGFGAVSIYFDSPWGYRLEITTWLADFVSAEAAALKRPGGGVMGGGQRSAR